MVMILGMQLFSVALCAVLRRCALMKLAGWAAETWTEDAHTSHYVLSSWLDFCLYSYPLAAGISNRIPLSVAHIGQRIRWAKRE